MKKLKKYFITLAIGLAIVLLVTSFNGAFDSDNPKDTAKYLCDGFFIATVIIGGLGLLVFVSSEGAFDMIVYGLQSFFHLFKTSGQKKYSSYYEYKESKAKEKIESGFMLYVGLFLLLITIILYIVYSNL